jgi:Transport protein particle (TRAPP) complex subunit
MTGMKFVLCADLSLSQQEARAFLKQLYEAFSDYVLKDPFFVVRIVEIFIDLLSLNNLSRTRISKNPCKPC